jgi:mannosyltransferase
MDHAVERHPSAEILARPPSGAIAPRASRHLLPGLALMVLAGAALRFSTLDLQSFWGDETLTVARVNSGFGDMLSQLTSQENSPPLYFVVAWLWSQAFGSGEIGLRSLSALCGVATIPLVYLLGRELCSQRVGLVAAALFALSPLMVHYGQEARSYALTVLLVTLSLIFFARALRKPSAGSLAGWAGTSALAVTSHYFAIFLVGAEMLLLLAAHRRQRPVLLASAVVAAVGAALVPLAVAQKSTGIADWIEELALATRAAQTPKQFLIGPDGPVEPLTGAASLLLAGAGAALVVLRGDARERAAARLGGILAAATVAVPLAASVTGIDVFTSRNAIVAWVPAAMVVATGFGARRAGRWGAGLLLTLLAVWVFVIIAVAADPRYQRDDWRSALEALGATRDARVIVLSPDKFPEATATYRPEARSLEGRAARVREVDLLALAQREPGGDLQAPKLPSHTALDGFRVVERERTETYALLRLRARSDRRVRARVLERLAIGGGSARLLLESPSSRPGRP